MSVLTKNDRILRTLLSKLEERRNNYERLNQYYNGEQPLAFLSPATREALKNRIDKLNVNIPRLVVTSLAERQRIVGTNREGQPDNWLWSVWNANDMDEQSAIVHREALALGKCFVLVWADALGRPVVTVESATQMYALEDPATREVLAAVKRWTRPDLEDPERRVDVAVLYLPNEILRFQTRTGTPPESGAWEQVGDPIPNPLGRVPVVIFKNSDRLNDEDGVSEMRDVLPATDGLTKLLSDLMVSSEWYAKPRRWATGVDLEDDDEEEEDEEGQTPGEAVTPFSPHGDYPWTTENDQARFGTFEASDLAAYETASRVLLGQIMAVSTLPAHYVGVLQSAPVSADSIRASEASLTARAHARMRTFGRSWEAVLRLIYEVSDRPLMPTEHASPVWADPATRTIAQEADAAAKISDSLGSVPLPLLERLGFNTQELVKIKNEGNRKEVES